MKIYRVSYRCRIDQEHTGYSFHTNKREAQELARRANANDHDVEIEKFEIHLTKVGVIRFLNSFADHPNNG